MLLIFHHIPKTAGTSLRLMLKQNYQPQELWELYGPHWNSVDSYRKFYQALTAEQKTSMRCVAAHSAHFLIPVVDQPFRVFCLLRDPVDRLISLYHFVQSIATTDNGRGGKIGREIKQRGWQLADIYLHLGEGQATDSPLHELFKYFFNGQIRILLAPHLATETLPFNQQILPSHYRQTLHTVLDQHYTLGVQEYYVDSIQRFAHEFGWQQIANRRENVSLNRPLLQQLPSELEQLIRSYNHLDSELHERYLRSFL